MAASTVSQALVEMAREMPETCSHWASLMVCRAVGESVSGDMRLAAEPARR
jgi:hypothetical protein